MNKRLIIAGVATAALIALGCSGAGSDTAGPPDYDPTAKASGGRPDPLTTDGTWLVGTEIQPGTYRSGSGQGCYYARLKATDGATESIIDNGNGPNKTVTIAPSDKAFEHARCGGWRKIG